jgi:hypothetical protein
MRYKISSPYIRTYMRNKLLKRQGQSLWKKIDSDTVIHYLRLKTVLFKAKEDELLQITSGPKRAHYLLDHLPLHMFHELKNLKDTTFYTS